MLDLGPGRTNKSNAGVAQWQRQQTLTELSVYEDFKIYGPYTRKDGRKHVCLVHLETGKRKTVSYPKYLMEIHLGKYLEARETVDHIDCDFTNDDLSNLRVLSRTEHARQDARTLASQDFTCIMCGKDFTSSGKRLRKLSSNLYRGQAGPFCSRSCVGKYGALVQQGKMDKLPDFEFNRSYTKLKFERLKGDFEIEPDEFGEPLTCNDDGNPEPSPKDGEGVETTGQDE